ncbi:MAG TPA: M20/M25/M40 family metallo-hydrolase, partial [Armatimonadota bacterium]|nr:M20/M25/M40 family metallo-hydrolase [Armatimonadota bacterium]
MAKQTDTQSVAELAAALVQIESINPGPAGDDVPGPRERDVSQYVYDWLSGRGMKAERREFLPGRFNVTAVAAGSGPKRLMVDAHMDTIPTEAMDIEPLSGEIRDGRVWGRGAVDDKGTLAAMMWALASLVESGVTPPATIELLASGDEEGGFRGIRDWVAQGGMADGAIVGEASELGLITASRGAVRFKVRTRGKPVHTCSPEKGINAVTHMARVLAAIEDDLKPKMLARTHPLLDGPRITPAMINGGRRANIVPDECVIDIDRRVLPCETKESALAEFDAMVERVAATDDTMTIER